MSIYIKSLRWTEWNIKHIAKHNVTVKEVEEVCSGTFHDRDAKYNRFMILGKTAKDRILAIILDSEEDGIFFPTSARPASRRERTIYHEQSKGGEKKV